MEELEKTYSQWKADIQTYIEEVESWENEIALGRRDLEQIRQALSKHSVLVRKHKDLLIHKRNDLSNRVENLRSYDQDSVMKKERSYMNVVEFKKLEELAHKSIQRAHEKLLKLIRDMREGLD